MKWLGNATIEAKNFYVITPANKGDHKKIIEKYDELAGLLDNNTFTTSFGGSLEYSSSKELSIDDVVHGQLTYKKYSSISKFFEGALDALIFIFTILIYVLVIYVIKKKISPESLDRLFAFTKKDFLISLGLGVLFVILVPLAFVLLCWSYIGVAVAILLAFVYVVLLLLSMPTVVFVIANTVKSMLGDKLNEYICIALIAVVLGLLLLIPYLNILIGILAVLVGSGMLGLSCFKKN